MIIDREEVFQLLITKNWPRLIDVLKDNECYSFISNEPMLKPAIDKYIFDELLTNSSIEDDPTYKYYLTSFYLLHADRNSLYKLNNENYKKLILRIIDVEKDIEKAFSFASKFPKEPTCKEVIDKYNKNLPKIVHHSQEGTIQVTENKDVNKFDASISLFKSNQEFQFYKAVKSVFPNFLVYPNVSLNAVIDFDLIKSKLTKDEADYFFKALIDCVVIDSDNQHKPIRFIELDSPFHDTELQINKDKLKDDILAKAGQKLIRIRRSKNKRDGTDFEKLIREIIK